MQILISDSFFIIQNLSIVIRFVRVFAYVFEFKFTVFIHAVHFISKLPIATSVDQFISLYNFLFYSTFIFWLNRAGNTQIQ